MKDTYIVPELEIIEMESSDIIITSPQTGVDEEDGPIEGFSLDPKVYY